MVYSLHVEPAFATPETELATAIIEKAFEDLSTGRIHKRIDAREFFLGDWFAMLGSMLGLPDGETVVAHVEQNADPVDLQADADGFLPVRDPQSDRLLVWFLPNEDRLKFQANGRATIIDLRPYREAVRNVH